MDKEQMQDCELHNVAGGGGGDHPAVVACRKCGKYYNLGSDYPDGFLLKKTGSGCSAVWHYKCPGCGYTWQEEA